jgi:hypothetical protein
MLAPGSAGLSVNTNSRQARQTRGLFTQIHESAGFMAQNPAAESPLDREETSAAVAREATHGALEIMLEEAAAR